MIRWVSASVCAVLLAYGGGPAYADGGPCKGTVIASEQPSLQGASKKVKNWVKLVPQDGDAPESGPKDMRAVLLYGGLNTPDEPLEGAAPMESAAILIDQGETHRIQWPFDGQELKPGTAPALSGRVDEGEGEGMKDNIPILRAESLPLPCREQPPAVGEAYRFQYSERFLLLPILSPGVTKGYTAFVNARVCDLKAPGLCAAVEVEQLQATKSADTSVWTVHNKLTNQKRAPVTATIMGDDPKNNGFPLNFRVEATGVDGANTLRFYPNHSQTVRPKPQLRTAKAAGGVLTFSATLESFTPQHLGVLQVTDNQGKQHLSNVMSADRTSSETTISAPPEGLVATLKAAPLWATVGLGLLAVFAVVAFIYSQFVKRPSAPDTEPLDSPRTKMKRAPEVYYPDDPDPRRPTQPQGLAGHSAAATTDGQWSHSTASDSSSRPPADPKPHSTPTTGRAVGTSAPSGPQPTRSSTASRPTMPPEARPVAESARTDTPTSTPRAESATPTTAAPQGPKQPTGAGSSLTDQPTVIPEEDDQTGIRPRPVAPPANEPLEVTPSAEEAQFIKALYEHGDAGEAAGLLADVLYKHGPAWARAFNNAEHKAQFNSWLKDSLFYAVSNAPEALDKLSTVREDWVEPELIPSLDTLAHFASLLAQEVFLGNHGAKRTLERWYETLFDDLSDACLDVAGFTIETVKPFEDAFDPTRFSAGGESEVVEGASGKVIRITQLGRLNPDGTVQSETTVIAGL